MPAPLHLVFVPFLARSHFAPLAAAAAAACGDGATGATILTTPHFAALAPPSVPVRAAPFSFPGGHEDFSLLPDEASAPAFFFAAEATLAPALAEAVRAHAGAVAVVSDAVLHWAPRVARECGVPHVTFHTIGAFAAASMVAVHLHRPDVTVTGAAERDSILQWLDGQAAGSVVYACFGSTCGLSADQLKELGAGLRASGKPFLWVIPAATEGTKQHDERASGHGMVVAGRWAPQAEILAHRAVGGFVSHCGWNSVLDAVCAGVPLATWPLRAEQFLNEALLVDVLRVGVRVREVGSKADVEAVVPADKVASAVGKLMDGGADEAAARRVRVRELGVAGRAAVAEGGSSCSDWARLVDELKALHGHGNDALTDK
ncbi:unnamed protein product [Triticum turgidum subsp. durum]|uniref:Glycosyltransferase n=1 Tax=Triticum turgidum subsp. durum TaxID=4567 RepID=A0A9R0SWN2_TRITD|nr:unnamed protein product [Triticum turgidum subsp. durum]